MAYLSDAFGELARPLVWAHVKAQPHKILAPTWRVVIHHPE
jgi:hypothetical protein